MSAHLAVQSGPLGSPSGGDSASSCVISSLSEPDDSPTPRRSNYRNTQFIGRNKSGIKNDSTYCLVDELGWRTFCLMGLALTSSPLCASAISPCRVSTTNGWQLVISDTPAVE